jgi:hypothetical protein
MQLCLTTGHAGGGDPEQGVPRDRARWSTDLDRGHAARSWVMEKGGPGWCIVVSLFGRISAENPTLVLPLCDRWMDMESVQAVLSATGLCRTATRRSRCGARR